MTWAITPLSDALEVLAIGGNALESIPPIQLSNYCALMLIVTCCKRMSYIGLHRLSQEIAAPGVNNRNTFSVPRHLSPFSNGLPL